MSGYDSDSSFSSNSIQLAFQKAKVKAFQQSPCIHELIQTSEGAVCKHCEFELDKNALRYIRENKSEK